MEGIVSIGESIIWPCYFIPTSRWEILDFMIYKAGHNCIVRVGH